MSANLKNPESSFIFKGQKKEFLDWLESLRISRYWLDTMSQKDSYALCKEINQVLRNFKELDLDEKEKLFSLIEINSCLQGVYEKLHDEYLDASLPLNQPQQETVQLIIHTYLDLSNAYYGVIVVSRAKKNKLSDQHLALAACKGLQGLGVVFLTASEIYINPPQGFWLLCYSLFSVSEELSLLDSKVKIDNAIYSAAVLFKKLIIFYIVEKNQYSPREIDSFFQTLIRGINYIQSYILAVIDVSGSAGTEIFGFSLTKDEPPSLQSNVSLATAKLLRYVEKFEVIKIVQFLLHEAKEQQNSANMDLFTRILASLENQKQKRQTRINKQYSCRALVGLDDLVDFLLAKENKKKTVSNQKTTNEFDDELDSLQMVLDWNAEDKHCEQGAIIEDLQIVNSSMSGYDIHWNNNIAGKLKVGEVIGIIPGFNSSRKGIETGLIRKIKVTGDEIIFSVELIGLESTLIYIERENQSPSSEWVLFLFGSPNYDVGILTHKQHNYQAGESIFVQVSEKAIPCKLGAILNSTSLLDHIALVY